MIRSSGFSGSAAAVRPGVGNLGVTQGRTIGAGGTGHGEEQVLHLGSELAALCLFLDKSEDPIKERAEEAGDDDLVEVLVLDDRCLVRAQYSSAQADQGVEAETGCNLKFAISKAD